MGRSVQPHREAPASRVEQRVVDAPANPGVPLNLEWIDEVRVNTSAVERRAATLVTRRTVKKDWQIAWLLKAITCMDLTTLSGDDTHERVRRLCAKARSPLHRAGQSAASDRGLAGAGGRRVRVPPVRGNRPARA